MILRPAFGLVIFYGNNLSNESKIYVKNQILIL